MSKNYVDFLYSKRDMGQKVIFARIHTFTTFITRLLLRHSVRRVQYRNNEIIPCIEHMTMYCKSRTHHDKVHKVPVT